MLTPEELPYPPPYGRSPAMAALELVKQLNGLRAIEIDPSRATYEFIEAMGIPASWLKRPPNRNHILLKLYERSSWLG